MTGGVPNNIRVLVACEYSATVRDAFRARVHKMPPGPDRWKERSRTFPGVAAAMADQWGDYLLGLHREAA